MNKLNCFTPTPSPQKNIYKSHEIQIITRFNLTLSQGHNFTILQQVFCHLQLKWTIKVQSTPFIVDTLGAAS